MTEEEQLESIKKWWQRNGTVITVCASILLFAVAGYRYYDWHQAKITQQASITYERMMVEFSNHNNKSVRAYANELIKEYNHSVYADVAHLTLAKLLVSKDKLQQATNELQIVANNSRMAPLKQIAKIRIARILAANKSYTDALKELSTIEDKTYMPVINELKGDIYGATGQFKEAISSYKLAIDEVKTTGMGNLFLEMKTNDIANKSQSMGASDSKVQAA